MAPAASTQAAIDSTSRMKPAHHGEQARNQHHDKEDDIEQRNRHSRLVRSLFPPETTVCAGGSKIRPAGCIAGLGASVTRLVARIGSSDIGRDPGGIAVMLAGYRLDRPGRLRRKCGQLGDSACDPCNLGHCVRSGSASGGRTGSIP